jgi:transcriptional regulator with XRE-family HTH domain
VQLILHMKDKSRVKFNNKGLALALDAVRGSKDMNWLQVAEEMGVSPSTISRILMGKNPDADSLAKIVNWCGIDFRHLIVDEC